MEWNGYEFGVELTGSGNVVEAADESTARRLKMEFDRQGVASIVVMRARYVEKWSQVL